MHSNRYFVLSKTVYPVPIIDSFENWANQMIFDGRQLVCLTVSSYREKFVASIHLQFAGIHDVNDNTHL